MRVFSKIILFGMMLTPLIFAGSTFTCLTDTFAYFRDTEHISNTLNAGYWDTEADFLEVSDSKLTGNGEKLHGITLDANGTRDITIDKIQVWWNISLNEASNITEITIGGKKFFTGSEPSGEILDGENYVLEAKSSAKIEFYFDSNVSNLAPFTINIIMGDRSVKSFMMDPKYHSDVPEAPEQESASVGL